MCSILIHSPAWGQTLGLDIGHKTMLVGTLQGLVQSLFLGLVRADGGGHVWRRCHGVVLYKINMNIICIFAILCAKLPGARNFFMGIAQGCTKGLAPWFKK